MIDGERASILIELAVHGLYLSTILSMPMVVAAAVVGTLLAVVQALTQIQEQTLGYAVKLIAVTVVMILLIGWIGSELFKYSTRIFDLIPLLGR